MSTPHRLALFGTLVLTLGAALAAQGLNSNDGYVVHSMLHDAYDAVKKNYYDPKFHGVDLDARYKDYEAKLKTAPSLNAGVAMVAAFLDGLQDSHTYFSPPMRPYKLDYGYRIGFAGGTSYIVRVRPDTDAASKVHPGDQVLSVNGGPVTRDSFRTMQYYLNLLSPQNVTRLQLRDPSGAERTVDVTTKVTPRPKVLDLTGADADQQLNDLITDEEESDHLMRQRYIEAGDVMLWKVPEFLMENAEVDKLWSIARKHAAVVLDLRGNPGGAVDTLNRMIANVMDHDVTIGQRVSRKGSSPMVVKSRGAGNVFTGKLIVIVDSESASCSEIFARVIQLEKRGTVVGDRSAGAVMEARLFPFAQETTQLVYEVMVTDADLIMQDGKSLEKVGVTPDDQVLPAASDLAAGVDPVLAHAAQLAGLAVSPQAAGKMFPFEWAKIGK
jgi:C-terminal processing protease CtpA/Prc